MQRHLVIIAITFVSAILATDQPAPCPADFLKDRIVAGFYKESFFYFAYGDDPKIELDPKTLFGD
uniref:Uncharacterized protein n=1 Tax=Steinernema glaseri TaxID=37863 RepID=A0A1I7ZZ88_9BILA